METKRKNRILVMVLSMLLVIALLTGCGSDNSGNNGNDSAAPSTSTDGNNKEGGDDVTTGDTKFDERVTLYVTAFVSNYEPDGRRTDPVSKYIEENLNIDLELTGVIESDYPTQLSAMIASRDLPDVFLLSDAVQQVPMLMSSNSILCIDPYLEEYAPNTLADPNGLVMLEAYRSPAFSPDGKVYLWGLCKGAWDDGTQPTCGHYIRWDLYKEAGYPRLETYDEDLLDVLEQLVALEPETDDGQKTYGTGAWFGDGQGWGEWVFTYGLAPQEGANLAGYRTLAISTIDSTPKKGNQLTDPNGYFWRAVQFYNRANQRGLLDPDSFTQKSDVYEEKLKNGRYMFNVPGWMAGNANAEFNKKEGNLKTFVSLPSIQADAEDRFGNMYRGERIYCISSDTEHPERCVALLDFVSTYDFSLIAWNGLEGTLWNMENGVPVPTEEYLSMQRDAEVQVKIGAQAYHHFCGYGNGSVHPDYGVCIDLLQYSPQAVEKKMNDTIRDFVNHYGQKSWVDVYRAETTNTDSMNLLSFGEPPEDLKNYINNMEAYIGKNIFKAVAAKDDAEFEAIRDEMITVLKNEHHIDEIYQYFYDEATSQADQVARLAELINKAK
jgi:putative aldouronate transport system substrate-binding protein